MIPIPTRARAAQVSLKVAKISGDVKERYASNKVDVAQFVQHAWGLKGEDVEAITNAAKDGKFSLPEDHLLCIKEEQDAYRPFFKIAESLIEQVRSILLPDGERRNIFYENRGKCILRSNHSERKPDALAIPANHKGGQKITWRGVIAPFEFKTRHLTSRYKVARLSLSIAASASRLFVSKEEKDTQLNSSAGNSTGGDLVTAASKGHKSSGSPPRSRRNSDVASPILNAPISSVSSVRAKRTRVAFTQKKVNLNYRTGDPSTTESVNSTLKRKADDDADLTSPKRPYSVPRLTDDQLQLTRYAIECMAASSRHYVTGIFVDTFTISLWYYHRTIVACTSTSNFEKEPGMLALVLYGLSIFDLHHAGFNCFIIPPTTPRPSNLEELFDISPSMGQSRNDEIIFFPKNNTSNGFELTGKCSLRTKA